MTDTREQRLQEVSKEVWLERTGRGLCPCCGESMTDCEHVRYTILITDIFADYRSGLASLRTVDEELRERTYHISSGFGLRQLATAGVTANTWISAEIGYGGVIESFEILNHNGLSRSQQDEYFGEAGHGDNDFHPSEVV